MCLDMMCLGKVRQRFGGVVDRFGNGLDRVMISSERFVIGLYTFGKFRICLICLDLF